MKERGQVIAMGMLFMLVFGVSAYSGAQATVVPQQNEETEFNHQKQVLSDMVEVHSAIGTDRAVAVDMGTRYAPRAIFVNPPPVYGSLRTTQGTVTIDAAGAPGEAVDFWSQERTLPTAQLVYSGDYNEMELSDIVVERSAVYKDHSDAVTVQSDVDIVNDRKIELPTIRGDVSTTQISDSEISMTGRDS
jgi:hypothetical protein